MFRLDDTSMHLDDTNMHSLIGNMSHSVYNRRMTQSTFVKLNKKRGIAKGLGHSNTNKNHFDRRYSVTTQSSTEKGSNSTYCRAGDQSKTQTLTFDSHLQCNGFNGQFDFTEQRCNYERISQQQREQQQKQQFTLYDRHSWPPELVSRCQILNSRIPSCNGSIHVHSDPLADSKVGKKFVALQEFRKQNSSECYGNGSYLHDTAALQQLPCNFIPDSVNTYTRQLATALPSTPLSPMPYVLRQKLLRAEIAKDFKNRKARQEFLTSGLNKSLALSYQPMY